MTQTFNEDVVFNDQVTANDNVTIQGDDGRLHVGDDLGFSTEESYIEVHRDNTAPTTKPKRGLHSLGRIGGAISDAIAWLVSELELPGSGTITGIHSALRARLTHDNSGDSSGAEVQAGNFEVVNESGSSGTRVGQATGIQASISNKSAGYLDEAVGVDISIDNENGSSSPILNAYGLRVADIDEADDNFAIHTGKGIVHLGDLLELEELTASGTPGSGKLWLYAENGKIYAKNNSDPAFDLTTGGGALELLTSGNVDSGSAPASSITLTVPSTHKHLRLVLRLRSDYNSSGTEAIDIRLNPDTTEGDKASNYSYQYLWFQKSATGYTDPWFYPNSGTAASIIYSNINSAYNSSTDSFSTLVIDIFNYRSGKHKSAQCLSDFRYSSGEQVSLRSTGYYADTADITEIEIEPYHGDFVEDCSWELYGIS